MNETSQKLLENYEAPSTPELQAPVEQSNMPDASHVSGTPDAPSLPESEPKAELPSEPASVSPEASEQQTPTMGEFYKGIPEGPVEEPNKPGNELTAELPVSNDPSQPAG